MRAWGAIVSSGHVVLALAGWLVLGIPPWFFAGCALLTLGVALLAAPLMGPRQDPDDDDHGGGPGPETPGPPWWPDFERDFRAYDEARRRTAA